jgi:hypothetical protein
MSIEYWISCQREPWDFIDEDFAELAASLSDDGEADFEGVTFSVGSAPEFVPSGTVVINACGRAGANWDDALDILAVFAEAGQGVVIGEDERAIFDHRVGLPAPQALDHGWIAGVDTNGLTVYVFAMREPHGPRQVLTEAGLQDVARRFVDQGFWNNSSFGAVRVHSMPSDASRSVANTAGVDRFHIAVKFSTWGPGDWNDALRAVQALTADVKGQAFAFYDYDRRAVPIAFGS